MLHGLSNFCKLIFARLGFSRREALPYDESVGPRPTESLVCPTEDANLCAISSGEHLAEQLEALDIFQNSALVPNKCPRRPQNGIGPFTVALFFYFGIYSGYTLRGGE